MNLESPNILSPLPDTDDLLSYSLPQPRVAWLQLGVGTAAAIMLGAWFASRQSSAADLLPGLASLLTLLLVVGGSVLTRLNLKAHRAEQAKLDGIDELLQLRRWPESMLLLLNMLSQPMRSMMGRVRALIYLSSLLSRLGRFQDVITVDDHLLDAVLLDEQTAHVVKVSRAMAMLRIDHLVDADRAISELRRSDSAGDESAGVTLVELYRDVKTGHPQEAIEMFHKRLPSIRRLGHRAADAWILLSRAYDFSGKVELAAEAFATATLLAPLVDLQRRYPEVAVLASKYRATLAPGELA